MDKKTITTSQNVQWRQDPVLLDWILYDPGIPFSVEPYHPDEATLSSEACPFCPHHETATPPEILAYRDNKSPPNSPDWSLRVIPNRIPILNVSGVLKRRVQGIYNLASGLGAHEIFIESPDHHVTLATMETQAATNVFRAYRQRLWDLIGDRRIRAAVIYKNSDCGPGACIAHSYSELVAMVGAPTKMTQELAGARRFYRQHGHCLYCEMIKIESSNEPVRMIVISGDFYAFVPYAARSPYEVWILPRRHACRFMDITDGELSNLAVIVQTVLNMLQQKLGAHAWHYEICSSPFDMVVLDDYHWHMKITPHAYPLGGLEFGSDSYVSPVLPETAAEELRNIRMST